MQPDLQDLRLGLVLLAQALIGLQMRDRGRGPCRNGRRQRCGKDEARRVRPYRVTHFRAGRDIAAHHAIGLGQGAVDDVDPVHQPVALGHAAPRGPYMPTACTSSI